MKKWKEIIASDLLERYVLGNVSNDERIQVDDLRRTHLELEQEINRIEQAFEKLAMENAIPPPSGLSIDISDIPNSKFNTSSQFSKVWWRVLTGALITGILVYSFLSNRIRQANEELNKQAIELKLLQEECSKISGQYAFLNNKESIPITLSQVDADYTSRVVIYWNKRAEQSLLRVINLPTLQASETYQLWADVKGEMLDLGTFDSDSQELLAMGYTKNASSLNITIEPEGGSKHPTISRLILSQTI